MKTLACLLLILVAGSVTAHEVRPAYLQIREQADTGVHILWKQPVRGDFTLAITPVLSSGWLDVAPDSRRLTGAALIKEWQVPPPHADLAGQTLEIRGLDQTITDVLVEISLAGGTSITRLVKAKQPAFKISADNPPPLPVNEYFLLGMTHIGSGPDHLAYVLALILLIGSFGSLIKTVTAFTAAHSITLAGATLGYWSLPSAAVETVIALSIVFAAVELCKRDRGDPGLTSRLPWLTAFIFGLLHGFGFAGALQAIGLPRENIPGALLLFNLGIEAGQILFILLVLALLGLLSGLVPLLQRRLLRLAPYGIGGLASYWLLHRLVLIL